MNSRRLADKPFADSDFEKTVANPACGIPEVELLESASVGKWSHRPGGGFVACRLSEKNSPAKERDCIFFTLKDIQALGLLIPPWTHRWET